MGKKIITYPLNILENVPTKVGKFVIPVDFIVLDMEEDIKIPILFGRLFLVTTGAIIDMKRGKITLEVDNEYMEFDVFKMMKSSPMKVVSRVDSIDVINECIDEVIHECLKQDPIEPYII